jgi:hypothetical protein
VGYHSAISGVARAGMSDRPEFLELTTGTAVLDGDNEMQPGEDEVGGIERSRRCRIRRLGCTELNC